MPHRIPVRCRELSRIPGATCLTQCETSHAPGSRGDLPNGCDGFLHCGTCSGLETCGGEAPNVCACTPRACPADASWSCENTSLPTDRRVALDGSAEDDLGVVGKLGAPAHRDGTGVDRALRRSERGRLLPLHGQRRRGRRGGATPRARSGNASRGGRRSRRAPARSPRRGWPRSGSAPRCGWRRSPAPASKGSPPPWGSSRPGSPRRRSSPAPRRG